MVVDSKGREHVLFGSSFMASLCQTERRSVPSSRQVLLWKKHGIRSHYHVDWRAPTWNLFYGSFRCIPFGALDLLCAQARDQEIFNEQCEKCLKHMRLRTHLGERLMVEG